MYTVIFLSLVRSLARVRIYRSKRARLSLAALFRRGPVIAARAVAAVCVCVRASVHVGINKSVENAITFPFSKRPGSPDRLRSAGGGRISAREPRESVERSRERCRGSSVRANGES